MAPTDLAEQVAELQNELIVLREEYIKLKVNLSDVELKYLSALNEDAKDEFNTKLKSAVSDLYNKPIYSDLVVKLGNNEKLFAHKVILSAYIDIWQDQNLDDLTVIDFTDVSNQVVCSVLKWMYTNNIDMIEDENYLKELLQFTFKYNLKYLKSRCEERLVSYVNTENCTTLYHLALKCKCLSLCTSCIRITPQHQSKKLESFSREDYDERNVKEDCNEEKEENCDEEKEENCDEEKEENCDEEREENCDGEKEKNTLVNNNKNSFYKCDVCGKCYTKCSSLKRHEITIHSKNGPYSCKICERTYAYNDSLQKHLKSHQETPEVYICNVCSRSFIDSPSLKRHQNIHFRTTLYKCTVCGKVFNNSSNCRSHVKRHITGSLKHICEICGASLHSPKSLEEHLNIHKNVRPYICDVCGRGFNQKNGLIVHQRYHTGNMPYKCKQCPKAFATNFNLRKHIRVHSGERPYKCTICNKAFSEHNGRKTHMRNVHAAEVATSNSVVMKQV